MDEAKLVHTVRLPCENPRKENLLHSPQKAHHWMSGSRARGGDWGGTGNSLGWWKCPIAIEVAVWVYIVVKAHHTLRWVHFIVCKLRTLLLEVWKHRQGQMADQPLHSS